MRAGSFLSSVPLADMDSAIVPARIITLDVSR
jgi:hypothetical protein